MPNTASDLRDAASQKFLGSLARWKRRERYTVAIEGLVWTLGAAWCAFAAAAWFLDMSRFDPNTVSALRLAVLALAIAMTIGGVVLRVLTVAGLQQIAKRADAYSAATSAGSSGGADALVNSAFEAAQIGPQRDSDALVARLLDAATERLRVVAPRASRAQPRRQRAAWMAVSTILVAAGAYWLASPGLQYAAQLLLRGSPPLAAMAPYRIDVVPGDQQVLEGDPVMVRAALNGFAPETASLRARHLDESWRTLPMRHLPGEQAFELLIPSVTARTEYSVHADGVDSRLFTLEVIPLPKISRIDVEYEYPAYTGRPRTRLDNITSVSAIQGTVAHLYIHVGGVTNRGAVVVDGEPHATVAGQSGSEWQTQFSIRKDGQFRVDLEAADGRIIAATPELPIYALPDDPVRVQVLSPGKDAKVTSVEEIEIVTEATDDTSLRQVELIVSINGQDEQVISMLGKAVEQHVQPTHLMMLEERKLAPGDLIAYYVRATDDAANAARMRQSDIFFMEVRPFEKRFKRASGGGAGRGGRGGQSGDLLAAQQRSLVIGLFNLNRDSDRLDKLTRAERLAVLTTAQARIRVRTEAIVRRTKMRAGMRTSRAMEQMTEALPKAVAAMAVVESQLKISRPDQALPKAREALAYLQRADAAFREVRVASQRNRGGGGRQSAAEDLGNLFKLEMDKFKSQYAHVQHGRRNRDQRPLDDALQQLRQLAERQLRNTRRTQSSAAQQEVLARAVDDLIRRLQRLSAKDKQGANQSPEIADASAALQRAADAMRRSDQATRGAGEAKQRLDRQIANALEQARAALAGKQKRRLAESLRQRKEEVAQLRRDQAKVENLMREQAKAIASEEATQTAKGIAPSGDTTLTSRAAQALVLKQRMRNTERMLRAELERVIREGARQAGAGGPKNRHKRQPNQAAQNHNEAAVAAAKDAARALRQGRTEMRLAWTEQALQRDPRAFREDMEQAISQSLKGAADAMANAQASAEATDESSAALRARLRGLAFQLAELERRTRAAAGTQENLRSGTRANETAKRGESDRQQQANSGARTGAAGGAQRRGGTQGGAANDRYFVTGVNNARAEARRLGRALVDRGHEAKDINGLLDALDGIETADARVGARRLAAARDAVHGLLDSNSVEGDDSQLGTPSMTPQGRLPIAARGLAERYTRGLSELQ